MKTRVRVKRADLIKVVDGRVRKAQKDYDRAVTAYPERVKVWEEGCVKTLRAALASAERGKMPIDRYGSPRIVFPDRPLKPSEGRELCNLRRMLATLRMGAEETILLSQEDADAYFGECRL
jgi:hypothetical protein